MIYVLGKDNMFAAGLSRRPDLRLKVVDSVRGVDTFLKEFLKLCCRKWWPSAGIQNAQQTKHQKRLSAFRLECCTANPLVCTRFMSQTSEIYVGVCLIMSSITLQLLLAILASTNDTGRSPSSITVHACPTL